MISLSNPVTWLAGYIPDIPTPFDNDGAIDLSAFTRLCERQIDAGVSAIVVSETGGEASTLNDDEKETIIRTAVKVARGRVRVIAGTGSNSTSKAIELTKRAEACGADAALSVVPYYNKPMQSGIYAHFHAVANSTALPIILHDVPSRTMRELADDTLLRLADLRRFIGLKDSAGDIGRLSRLRPMLPPGFRLLSGDDATAPTYVANGGDGCISTVSNVAPELCRTIFSCCRLSRPHTAKYLQNRLALLTAALANENPAALKYALCLLGFMSPAIRLPLVELDEAAKSEVANAIAAIGDEDIAYPIEDRDGPLHERVFFHSPA